jgi:hypothetical protein
MDRALLLAALLQAKGMQPRFASATLSDKELGLLGAQLTVVPNAYDAGGSNASPQPSITAAGEKMSKQLATLLDSGTRRADNIVATLSAGHVSLTNDAPPALEQFRRHVWIRTNSNGGTIDLDPSLSQLHPGNHLGFAAAAESADLQTGLYATLAVRLTATYDATGAGGERELASRQFRVADLGLRPIHIDIVPSDASVDLMHLTNNTQLVPEIGLDNDVGKASTFSVSDPSRGQIRSLKLEITTTQPGLPSRKYDRWLLTGGDQSNPDITQIVGFWTLLVQDAPANIAFIQATMLGTAENIPVSAQSDQSSGGNQRLYPADLLMFFTWDTAASESLEQRLGVTFQYDRPRLALKRVRLSIQNAKPVVISTFDIVENAVAAYGERGAYANVVLGAFDTQLENDVIGQGTISSIKALDSSNGAMQVLRTSANERGQYLGLQQSFDRGSVAVAMNAPVTIQGTTIWSWWDVDPHGGATVGRSTGGIGQDTTEYLNLTTAVLKSELSFINAAQACGSASKSAGKCVCSLISFAINVSGVFSAAATSLRAVNSGVQLGGYGGLAICASMP